MTSDADSAKKRPFRHRVQAWLHRYLALDVAPPPEADGRDPTLLAHNRAPARPVVDPGTLQASDVALSGRDAGDFAGDVPTLAAGACVGGVYEIVAALGGGRLSRVYRVHHRQWNTDLLMTLPSAELASAPVRLRQWLASLDRWAGLGVHPHIASCYSVQPIDGVPCVLTEFAEGGTLRTVMGQEDFSEVQMPLRVAIGVCLALEHAHSRGVIHGNITPDAILLTPQRSPKLSDFDLAAAQGAAFPSASVTPGQREFDAPAYVAPECWAPTATAQPAADVFAFGVCLYEMLFGRPPFAATDGAPPAFPRLQVLRTGEPPPEALLELLRSCVDWVPLRRPPSIEAVRTALTDLYANLFGAAPASVEDTPSQAAEWNTKGVASYLAGGYADADAAWATALETHPGCLEAWFNRHVVRWRRGQVTDEALLDEIAVLRVAPADRWLTHYLLALVHHERGDLDAAVSALDRARQEAPESAVVAAAYDRLEDKRRALPQHRAVVGEHQEYVSAVGINADGRVAVSASDDGTAVLWEVATGSHLRVLTGHQGPVTTVVLDNERSMALTGGTDGTLRLWMTATGACRRVLDPHAGRISTAGLSADGRSIAWAGVRSSEQVEQITLQVWEANTGRQVRTFEGISKPVRSLCFSADGYWLVTGGDDQLVRLWSVETGVCERTFAGHEHFVSGVCISPDNRVILSGSWDRSVRLWDVEGGKLLRTFEGHTALVTSVCLSADVRWALSGSLDCTVRLWEVKTGRCLRTFQGHSGLVMGVAFSADGRWAVSGGWDRTVRIWATAADWREPCQLLVSGSPHTPPSTPA